MTLTYHPGILGPVVRPIAAPPGSTPPPPDASPIEGIAAGPAYPGYLPLGSTEYVFVPVSAPAGLDVTTLTAEIALVAEGSEPAGGDWNAAEWAAGQAAMLYGPGESTYTAGHYMAWLRITSGAQKITTVAGRVRVGDPRF